MKIQGFQQLSGRIATVHRQDIIGVRKQKRLKQYLMLRGHPLPCSSVNSAPGRNRQNRR